MGVFSFIKNRKQEKQNATYVKMLDGSLPVYSQFGTNIYASDVVQQAVYTIITEMIKLQPRHIRVKGFDPVPVEGKIQNILDSPNKIMTTAEFIEKFMWNLILNYNSFIYMEKDNKGDLTGLYPISPVEVTFLETPLGSMYVKMLFKNGYSSTLPYENIIHLKTHYAVNDFMGGNESGCPDHSSLLETLKLNDILLTGLKKALNASFAINGIVKYNTMIDDGTMEKNIREFEEKLKKSNSGILGIDNKAEVMQLKRDIALIDDKTLQFIDDKILRNFGTPLEIVRGKYTAEEYEAFYQKTIEPLVVTASQGFTKGIFTKREKDGYKNEIKFYPKELIFMNMTQTLAMVNLLGQSGALYENEKRVAFGYAPSAELVGVRQKSLNYVDVSIANEYQLKNKLKKGEKE